MILPLLANPNKTPWNWLSQEHGSEAITIGKVAASQAALSNQTTPIPSSIFQPKPRSKRSSTRWVWKHKRHCSREDGLFTQCNAHKRFWRSFVNVRRREFNGVTRVCWDEQIGDGYEACESVLDYLFNFLKTLRFDLALLSFLCFVCFFETGLFHSNQKKKN